VMRSLQGPVRFALVGALILLWVIVAGATLLVLRSSRQSQRLRLKILMVLSGLALRTMGFHISINADLGARLAGRPAFIVSNHLSWIDVLIIASLHPTVFVTSVEVRDSGFLGTLCKLAGCHFVERRNRSDIANEVERLAEELRGGLSVCVFPEGTTSTGAAVLPFKVSLFDAAIAAGVAVQPICLNYLDIDGTPVDLESGRKVFWYGDMDFLPHFWSLMFVRKVSVRATILEKIPASPQLDRKGLAQAAHATITSQYVQMA